MRAWKDELLSTAPGFVGGAHFGGARLTNYPRTVLRFSTPNTKPFRLAFPVQCNDFWLGHFVYVFSARGAQRLVKGFLPSAARTQVFLPPYSADHSFVESEVGAVGFHFLALAFFHQCFPEDGFLNRSATTPSRSIRDGSSPRSHAHNVRGDISNSAAASACVSPILARSSLSCSAKVILILPSRLFVPKSRRRTVKRETNRLRMFVATGSMSRHALLNMANRATSVQTVVINAHAPNVTPAMVALFVMKAVVKAFRKFGLGFGEPGLLFCCKTAEFYCRFHVQHIRKYCELSQQLFSQYLRIVLNP